MRRWSSERFTIVHSNDRSLDRLVSEKLCPRLSHAIRAFVKRKILETRISGKIKGEVLWKAPFIARYVYRQPSHLPITPGSRICLLNLHSHGTTFVERHVINVTLYSTSALLSLAVYALSHEEPQQRLVDSPPRLSLLTSLMSLLLRV
jgi:hypothetical protein